MRESDWKITFDELKSFGLKLVVLDFGDLMDTEINFTESQIHDVGAFDFVDSARPTARGNRRLELQFQKRVGHQDIITAWQEAANKQSSESDFGLWENDFQTGFGQTGKLKVASIQHRDGIARFFDAAFVSTKHQPSIGRGLAETIHQYSMRLLPLHSLRLDNGSLVFGGSLSADATTYNAPTLPSSVSIGDELEIGGEDDTPGRVSGGRDGKYIAQSALTSGSSGAITVTPAP